MKERLDQLRAMDSAAFMALPASSFSPMPKEAAVDPEEIAAVSSPYTNLNGYIPHAEGERRRKEMLEVATMLEERYRTLLPPDRVRKAQESVLSESTSRTQVLSRDGDDSETDQASVIEESKLRLKLPARSNTSTTSASSPAATTPTIKRPKLNTSSKQSSVIRILRTAMPTPYSQPPTLPHAEVSPLSPSPTIDMDTPPSPEPEDLELTPSSPLPTVATVLPQTPISNETSMVEPSSPDVSLSNGAANAFGTASEQFYGFLEEASLFTPPEQELPETPPEQEIPATPPEQEMPTTPSDQEMPATPSDQGMLIAPNGQEKSPPPSDQERPITPEPQKTPILQSQERTIIDQEILPTSPEQERISTPEPERRTSPEPERSIAHDQERVSSSSPSPLVPDRQPTPLERDKSFPPQYRRSPTPLVRDRSVSVIPELEPPLEERPVTPERLATPPTRESTTTSIPEGLPTPPAPERPTFLVEVADQDGLPVKEPSTLEPPMVEGGELERAETEDGMSVRAESEVQVPQNEPGREVVEVEPEANKMDVEQDGHVGPVGPIPSVAAIEEATVADSTIDTIPEETLIERTIVLDVSQVSADSDPTVIEQAADAPASEKGFNLGRPATPEQRPHTELIDIEAPIPTSSISAPRGRSRKRARLDPSSIQNESVSAPVRGPRVPRNHVTFRGASGEMEVTASAIMKAALHRTQREVTRHLNAFGVPVPNYIVQMGPPTGFDLPDWVFPPLSPAESEHAQGDFDVDIEDFELNPKTPSKRQVTPPTPTESLEADYTASAEVDRLERAIVQPTRQPGPKIVIPPLPPHPRDPEPVIEEDTVSLGDEDTYIMTSTGL